MRRRAKKALTFLKGSQSSSPNGGGAARGPGWSPTLRHPAGEGVPDRSQGQMRYQDISRHRGRTARSRTASRIHHFTASLFRRQSYSHSQPSRKCLFFRPGPAAVSVFQIHIRFGNHLLGRNDLLCGPKKWSFCRRQTILRLRR